MPKYRYKGVELSRRPMKFEAQVLSLAEIPPRLNNAVSSVLEQPDTLRQTIREMAEYGARQVLLELHRQGAPASILELPITVSTEILEADIENDNRVELSNVQSEIRRKLERRLSGDRLSQWTDDLVARRVPAMTKRYANRAVNEAFTLGRAWAIDKFQRPHFDLSQRNEKGQFETLVDAVNAGDVLVDAVVQTAIMDTNTCEECEEVDGEVMDLGDARQRALHPPYVKCLGGDRCRCVQIAILSNGQEIDVDEIDEDTID